MKFCPECGTKVEGMKFCPECGYSLNEPPEHLDIETESRDWSLFTPIEPYDENKKWFYTKTTKRVSFDDITKTFKMGSGKHTFPPVYHYKDIKAYEVIENDGIVGKSGGVGLKRAVVGGVLFGGVGAVVGGATKKGETHSTIEKLQIKIHMSNPQEPFIFIDFANSLKSDSTWAQIARIESSNIATILERIIQGGNAAGPDESLDVNAELKRRETLIEADRIKAKKKEQKKQDKANKSDSLSLLKEDLKIGKISKNEYNEQKRRIELGDEKYERKQKEAQLIADYKANRITWKEYSEQFDKIRFNK